MTECFALGVEEDMSGEQGVGDEGLECDGRYVLRERVSH